MGFVYGGNTYVIGFEEDHELHGLEVRLRSLSVGEFLKLTSPDEDRDSVDATFRLLADHLVSWNLELPETGEVPTTYDGIRQLPVELAMLIVSAWTDRIASVPAPLRKPSPSGLREMDLASLPMAAN